MSIVRLFLALFAPVLVSRAAQQWAVEEIVLLATQSPPKPEIDVVVAAEFTGPDQRVLRVEGFWDGDRTWRVRFTPTSPGTWHYRISSTPSLPGLAREGRLEVTPAAPNARGFLRRDPQFPQSFVYDNGERLFMWGNTTYHLLRTARVNPAWREMLTATRAHGMNKLRLHVGPQAGNPRAGSTPHTSPFLDNDASRPDFGHWQTLDTIVRACADEGLLADLIVFPYIRKADDDTAMRDPRYLRYVIARYAAFPNVMWCLTNEWNYSKYPIGIWQLAGRKVAQSDAWTIGSIKNSPRALSIHQQTRPDWNFTEDTWYSHAIIQLGVRNRGTTARVGDEWQAAAKGSTVFRFGDDWGNHSIVRNWNGRYPIVNDEYGYIGEPVDNSEPAIARDTWPAMSREKHRRIAWGVAVGGGYGSAGDKRTLADGSPYFTGLWHPTPEFDDIARLIGFFTRGDVPYWRMRPANDLIRNGTRVYALADAGSCYLFYAAAGGTFSAALPAGNFSATRFDPRTGEETPLKIQGASNREFTLPDANDWVVRVKVNQ